MAVNISATFTKDEKPRNGLEAIAGKLVDEDLLHAQYVVVATIRPKRIATDAEDGTKTPTIRLDHIEVLDGADEEAAKEILRRRFKDRTGIDDVPPASLFDVLPGDGGVPEADGEELLAEHREARAAREQGVPAAEFSGGGGDAA